MESPLRVQHPKLASSDEPGRQYTHSFSATLEIGGQLVCVRDDSVVALDTGATTNFVRLKRLDNRDSYEQKMRPPKVIPLPTRARSIFGDGRVGEVRYAADIKVGIAGCRGTFTALVFKAEIPALLRKGARDAP